MPNDDHNARERILDELTLAIDGPATPERVALVARMFADALKAADADGGMVTMVVENLDMRARVRARDERGASSVSALRDVVGNPMRAVQERPELRGVAAAFAKHARAIASLGGKFRRSRKIVARLDDNFTRAVEAAAEPPAEPLPAFVGVTDIYSPVLRVGRAEPNAPTRARVFLEGRPHDIVVAVEGERLARFFDAAKRPSELARIRIEAQWYRGDGGTLVLDVPSARLLDLTPWAPIRGAELINKLGKGLGESTLTALWAQFEDDA